MEKITKTTNAIQDLTHLVMRNVNMNNMGIKLQYDNEGGRFILCEYVVSPIELTGLYDEREGKAIVEVEPDQEMALRVAHERIEKELRKKINIDFELHIRTYEELGFRYDIFKL